MTQAGLVRLLLRLLTEKLAEAERERGVLARQFNEANDTCRKLRQDVAEVERVALTEARQQRDALREEQIGVECTRCGAKVLGRWEKAE